MALSAAAAATAVFALAVFIYSSAVLQKSQWVFDDHFAVAKNKDVTTDTPLLSLLKHDYWGQDITSDMSHKSWRPLSVLAFRLVRQAWFAAGGQGEPCGPDADGSSGADSCPSPLPYHVVNVLAHGIVSVLVFWLALDLFSTRLRLTSPGAKRNSEDGSGSAGAARQEGEDGATAAGADGLRRRRAGPADGGNGAAPSTAAEPLKQGPAAPTNGASSSASLVHVQLPALLVALLFALHPVHTEAVAGVVGLAELLCAAFALPALMLYLRAADGRISGALLPQAAALAGVVLLVWAAALCKEIGITVLGAAAAHDWLLLHLHSAPAALAARRQATRARVVRLALLAAAAAAYLLARSAIAGGDHISGVPYRRVENPIPFAPSPASRLLSTGLLHARYMGLLLWPQHLSADWSYNCIPLVHSASDPRNLATLALYAWLLALVAAAKPWHLLLPPAGKAAAPLPPPQAAKLAVTRWRLAIAAGLLVGPFFPASNVLFYVGTFIGERLLYLPSLGFCILLADLCLTIAAPLAPGSSGSSGSGKAKGDADGSAPQEGSSTASAGRRDSSSRVATWIVALAMAALLLFYGWRTAGRTADWRDEEALFGAAEKVCPGSAKVQLNLGIIARRSEAWDRALKHLDAAKAIDPTYCEADYWIGLTLLNKGQAAAALVLLHHAVNCKYVAGGALQALNQVYVVMAASSKASASAQHSWGSLLVSEKIHQLAEGCDQLEAAAAGFAITAHNEAQSNASLAACTDKLQALITPPKAAKGAQKQYPPSQFPLRGGGVPVSRGAAEKIRDCMTMRHYLYLEVAAQRDPKAEASTARKLDALLFALQQHPHCRLSAASIAAEFANDTGSAPTPKQDKQDKQVILELNPDGTLKGDEEAAGKAKKKPRTKGGVDAELVAMNVTHSMALQLLVNHFQRQDIYDPWLHLEWAELQLLAAVAQGPAAQAAPGSKQREAGQHLATAGKLFRRDLIKLKKEGKSSVRMLNEQKKGKENVTAYEALLMAMNSYDKAWLVLKPLNATDCELMLDRCINRVELTREFIEVFKGAGPDAEKEFNKLREGSRKCMESIQKDPECYALARRENLLE